jgi:hypothetical protein
MLVDFATRFAGGLCGVLLLIPRGTVPFGFLRGQCLIALGLLVVAIWFEPVPPARAALCAAAALSYIGSVGWGLGRSGIGTWSSAGVALVCAAVLAWGATPGPVGEVLAGTAERLSSGFLLGATLAAMLLGHTYLTSPAMSIDPLRRLQTLVMIGLGLRASMAVPGPWAYLTGAIPTTGGHDPSVFLLMRWGMGLLLAAVASRLAWRTTAIRSTQSSTGILYIAMILVLFGELSAMILGRELGVHC